MNTTGNASVSIPNTAENHSICCAIFNDTEPYKNEVLIYRDNDIAFVGPMLLPEANDEGGSFPAADLFAWMDLRFLEEDFHMNADASDVFHALFHLGYDKEPSPNIEISTRQTGVKVLRDFKGDQFIKVGSVMQELARTGLDFTMDGRRLLAGTLEDFLSTDELVLHDEGVSKASVSKEGSNFATDVAVFGNTEEAGGFPITGRATRSSSVYGLIQRSFTELTIKDRVSADANAAGRLEAMQPAPLRVKAALSPDAAFAFSDLLPGRRMDVRLGQVAGCISVIGSMRLLSVDINVNVSEGGMTEDVELSLIPLGDDGEVN